MSEEPVAELIKGLTRYGLTVATAESLTGGLLAGELVTVSGASKVFNGGVVSYHTQLKETLLGLDAALLAANGPVDPDVARQMAEGARQACSIDGRPADLGLATTGVAGPDPDPQTGKVAGTVFLGIATASGSRAVALVLSGDRPAIRAQTVAAAVTEALDELRSLIPEMAHEASAGHETARTKADDYSDRTGHEKWLILCPKIRGDTLLHLSIQGTSYALRDYTGSPAGSDYGSGDGQPFKARNEGGTVIATTRAFRESFPFEWKVDVYDEGVPLSNTSRWRDIITRHNLRLGIGT